MKMKVNNTTIKLIEGDITEMETDAIVNPANSQLILGGGVAGAIRQKGGPSIQEQCNKIGGTPVGTAVITWGGNLKAKHVIHAVGPMMGEGDEDNKLKGATLNSLKVADENNLKSIALPAISTGIFGYPIDRAAKIMLETAINYAKGETEKEFPNQSPPKTGLERIIFCLYGQAAYGVFEERMREINIRNA